jgi:hypothetical protein
MFLTETLIYRSPAPAELDGIKDSLKFSFLGTQGYTHIVVDGELSAELFKVGMDEKGEIKDMLFIAGDIIYLFRNNREYVFHNAELLPSGEIKGNAPAVMVYSGKRQHCESDNVRRLTGREISDAFKLFTGGKMTRGDEIRYTFRVRCSNREEAAVYGIYDSENNLLSTASAIAVNGKYALIGDIFTRPDARGQHLATSLCQHCCREILKKDKTPFLLCNKSMTEFYKRTEFVKQ